MDFYNIVDLFSGAGGLSYGFVQTGKVKIVAAAENNANARKTYKRNLKVDRLYPDVRTIDYSELLSAVGSVDIVIGGPPCQGFSNANRQHTSIISMNNRLVKEYVRAICELQPKAFVMENVAMLRSQVHRFMVENKDIGTPLLEKLDLSDDDIEILPAKSAFEGALAFVTNVGTSASLVWADSFYKIINVLYRFRINQGKFDASLAKYRKPLMKKLEEIVKLGEEAEGQSEVQIRDVRMANAIIAYDAGENTAFNEVIEAIEIPLLMQKALLKVKELTDNDIHVYGYKLVKGAVVASVKSYPVLDYIRTVLEAEPYGYTIKTDVLNAINYGAPQRRERFIIVGMAKSEGKPFKFPEATFIENFRTVYDAISDLQDVPTAVTVDAKPVPLSPRANPTVLERELRGRLLYNHVTTETSDVALERFKALKEGENFHNLTPELKGTYSNADRTQNTIYMRLRYDEPSGTVVNVRKSMWIHPQLDRAISIREAARLQTFPDSFVFEGTKDAQYQQIGNAVPPFLAKAIALSVIKSLSGDK